MVRIEAPPPPLDYRPPEGPLAVLYRDESLLIVDKPAGLLSVPGRAPGLADCVVARAEALAPGARAIHRLDLATSGAMALALDARALRIVSGQFAKRIVAKRYAALVARWEAAEEGRIDAPMRADWPNRPRQMIDRERGKPAATRWRVAAREGARARLALEPLTGRSHQLRLHCAALGAPILGDALYGGEPAPRLMLHAERLALRRPSDGVWIAVESPAPF